MIIHIRQRGVHIRRQRVTFLCSVVTADTNIFMFCLGHIKTAIHHFDKIHTAYFHCPVLYRTTTRWLLSTYQPKKKKKMPAVILCDGTGWINLCCLIWVKFQQQKPHTFIRCLYNIYMYLSIYRKNNQKQTKLAATKYIHVHFK